MVQLSIVAMKKLIELFDELRQLDEAIPAAYIDRLKKAVELHDQVSKIPVINWDDLKSAEDIERAEAIIHQKVELKNEIEKHLNVCGLTVRGDVGRAKPKRKLVRRSKDQIEYDLAVKAIIKAKKAELGLPWKGTIRAEDNEKLQRAVASELKKLKLASPSSAREA